MESRFAGANGIDLHYVDHGGSGPTLVVLHGLTANAHFFDALVEDGLGSAFRVLAVDQRGRGLTDKPDHGYSIEAHVADVRGLLDALGLGSILLAGHSYGGLVSYAFAAAHPERVRRMAVLDAPAEVDPTVAEQIKPSLARLDGAWPSFEDYLSAIREQPYYGDWWDPRIEEYFRADVEESPDGSVRPRSSSSTISETIDGVVDVDWIDVMRNVEAPTLFVRATGSYGPSGSPPICTEESAARTVGALSAGRLEEVDGNHMTAFFGGEAAVVARMMTTFLLEES